MNTWDRAFEEGRALGMDHGEAHDYAVSSAGPARPTHLNLAVRWENAPADRRWRTYEVTGTRHAYYLLRKLAQKDGFGCARLQDWLIPQTGPWVENVMALYPDDILGSDRAGKYRALLDRNNSHYDLER